MRDQSIFLMTYFPYAQLSHDQSSDQSLITPWSPLDLLHFLILSTLKPTYGSRITYEQILQVNLKAKIVHRDCHKLPKLHMGAPCNFKRLC
jgi:hypothetical protein